MDPEIEEMVVDITYEVHGVPVRFEPGPASDILVCVHQPQADNRSATTLDFAGGGFSVAEGYLTVLVRSSSFAADPSAAPLAETLVRFQRGPHVGQVFRLGQDPKDHDTQGYEQRLTLQKVS